ncbi:MAG TPA: N-acetylmuramoyl-L-alanine amidase [Gaiellaceae bacterium]
MRRAACLLGVACLVAPAAAWAAHRGGIAYVPASPRNYAHTHRTASAIRLIVIHDIEGTASGAIAWFRNPRAHASANYVVSRQGSVTQMVPDWLVAWHAGNGYVNAHSIGIEHEGYTGVPGVFTDAEYRASAKLVAQLAARYRIPVDRLHVIGHYQVPDPNHRGEFGGFAHHTDPGKTWNWTRFMGYVADYRRGVTPPPLAFDVTLPDLSLVQTVKGTVPLEALTEGEPAASVDFRLDGVPFATATAEPYAVDWDSRKARNGRHLLGVHAVAADGRTADATVIVKVANPPVPPAPPQILAQTLTEGETLSGSVRWEVQLKGKVGLVEFLVDGVLADAEFAAPFGFDWDTTQVAPGPHTLVTRATSPDGNLQTTATVNVVVDQSAPPPPAPAPQP